MNPSDPVCTPWQLTDPDETIYICPATERPRATTQANWAYELGMDFAHIRVLRRYVRIFTRQEVWDNEGRQAYFDWNLHKNQIGFYFLPDCYCWDGSSDGAPFPSTIPVDLLFLESLKGPLRVPDDYEFSHCGAAWEYVTRDHPRAIPVWYAEPW